METENIAKKSTIGIEVGLNPEKIPVTIHWSSSDNADQKSEAKAMLLSFFDKESKETLKIDLWTTNMQVIEMDRFFYNTLRAMADTYIRATGNTELANAMQQFVRFFGEKTESITE